MSVGFFPSHVGNPPPPHAHRKNKWETSHTTRYIISLHPKFLNITSRKHRQQIQHYNYIAAVNLLKPFSKLIYFAKNQINQDSQRQIKCEKETKISSEVQTHDCSSFRRTVADGECPSVQVLILTPLVTMNSTKCHISAFSFSSIPARLQLQLNN